jgi:hypothetical protein
MAVEMRMVGMDALIQIISATQDVANLLVGVMNVVMIVDSVPF